MKPRLLIFSLFLSCTFRCAAQSTLPLIIEETFSIKTYGQISKVALYIPIMRDYEKRQLVKDVEFSKPPRKVKKDGGYYALYELDERELFRNSEIKITTQLEIYDYDLKIAQKAGIPSTLKKREQKKYLKNTGFYNLKKQTELLAQFKNQGDQLSTARQIHDFVVQHLEYYTAFGKDMGALSALEEKKGDCTEYADLMIALCRYLNIPARRASGYTFSRPNKSFLSRIFKSSGHAWVELHFDEFGWIPFDPTHSDGSYITNFDNLSTKYVYLNTSESTPGIHWQYWGMGNVEIKKDRNFKIEESVANEITSN